VVLIKVLVRQKFIRHNNSVEIIIPHEKKWKTEGPVREETGDRKCNGIVDLYVWYEYDKAREEGE
jgi:hypothetical protein